jgi:hypothetical protein
MSDTLNGKPTSTFWIISGVALVWNLIGLMFYYLNVTMTPEAMATLTAAQQEFFSTTPTWATSAYAIAVTTGVFGSLFLLLRKAWAVPLFAVSLAGIVVQQFHAFFLANGLEVWGTGGIYLPAAVLIIGIALLWYSRGVRAKGWIA